MINRVPFFLPWLYPSLTWRMPATEKKLYLTFDDGPVPGPTDFVLETLRRYQIHGTFFCIGDNVRKHPALFRQILTEGHAIGNHTFNHLSGWKTSLEKYVMNTIQCDDVMKQQGYEPVALFRPPYGRITRAQIQALHAYKIIMWDVLTMDYQRSLSPETCLRNSIRSLRNGSIIVFHDSVKAEHRMAYALPRLIEYGIENGYTFHPVV
jgi:peptidoglycan/xylan/chitin deacetylase (PgdA/CDA1 family)